MRSALFLFLFFSSFLSSGCYDFLTKTALAKWLSIWIHSHTFHSDVLLWFALVGGAHGELSFDLFICQILFISTKKEIVWFQRIPWNCFSILVRLFHEEHMIHLSKNGEWHVWVIAINDKTLNSLMMDAMVLHSNSLEQTNLRQNFSTFHFGFSFLFSLSLSSCQHSFFSQVNDAVVGLYICFSIEMKTFEFAEPIFRRKYYYLVVGETENRWLISSSIETYRSARH